jgi:5-methylcytosine-specific restriction protein A
MAALRKSWHHFYTSAVWQKRRYLQLLHEPLCRHCRERGRAAAARVADHIDPHRGDWNKFRLGALQSLCIECHNRGKRVLELRGYGLDVGDDGWPLDPGHPANKRK